MVSTPPSSVHDILLLAYTQLSLLNIIEIRSFLVNHLGYSKAIPDNLTEAKLDTLVKLSSNLHGLRGAVEDVEGLADMKDHLLPLAWSIFPSMPAWAVPSWLEDKRIDPTRIIWLENHSKPVEEFDTLRACKFSTLRETLKGTQ
jgi:hypothetical protein